MKSQRDLSIYIIHYSKLIDRKANLIEILNRSAVSAEWVTEKDFEFFPSAKIEQRRVLGVSRKILGMDLGVNSRSLVYSRKKARIQGFILFMRSYLSLPNNLYTTGSLPNKIELPKHQLELQQMHLTALRRGVLRGSSWILVLEDDAIPADNAFQLVDDLINSYKPKKTWMNLNSGANLIRTSSDPRPDKFGLFRVIPAGTRCAAAYLVSKDLAIEILRLIEKFGRPTWLPIDLVYQAALRKTKAKAYWQEPVSFLQGSEAGHFKSNLDGRRG
jgi:hypothetical protein